MFAKRISCLFKLNASRVTAVNALSLHNIAGRRETRPNRTVKKKGAARTLEKFTTANCAQRKSPGLRVRNERRHKLKGESGNFLAGCLGLAFEFNLR